MVHIEDVLELLVLAVEQQISPSVVTLFQGETAAEDGRLLQNHIW